VFPNSPFSQSEPGRLEPLSVAVLSGGDSAERAISLESGEAVSDALRARGHGVIDVDPLHVDLTRFDWRAVDLAFLALHGRFGEDGQVQALLESANVPYTGSDPAASRLGISKSASKERFFQCGVPTPHYVLIHESDTAQRISHQAKTLGYPLVVKPDTQGSSLGVSIARSPDDLPAALAKCFHYDSFGILESGIIGAEFTAPIIDETVLPLIQITTNRPFFDYQAKYEDDGTGYRFEFDVNAEVVRRIERVARNACTALGTRGVARVDIMLDRLAQPWVLEVNTIPGFTSHSLVPKAAARWGWSFEELCERSMQSALRIHQGRRRRLREAG
jgi:D-alanine-D-alanine ligase